MKYTCKLNDRGVYLTPCNWITCPRDEQGNTIGCSKCPAFGLLDEIAQAEVALWCKEHGLEFKTDKKNHAQ